MSQPIITAKTRVLDWLNDQYDTIATQKTMKLDHIKQLNVPLHEIIEYVYQFLSSFDPPLEIEKLSLTHNQLDELPLNIKLLSKTVRYLDLHDNNFCELPMELTDFNLEILDMSNNRLNYLSKLKLLKLENLKLVNLKDNKFKYLPPVLGELPNLNLIEVANNPLIIPSPELIAKFQRQTAVDWVKELKQYLVINSLMIESKIYESLTTKTSNASSSSGTPQLSRAKSISETKTKASKAARRMGLIIKKPEGEDMASHNDSSNNSHDFPSPLNVPHSSSSIDSSFIISPQVSNVGTTTASTNTAPSNGSSNPHLTSSSPPLTPTVKSRSRSNTLVEIDKMLDDNDDDHKSGAYFRRLSTLAEVPIDETMDRHSKPRSNPPTIPIPNIPKQSVPNNNVPNNTNIASNVPTTSSNLATGNPETTNTTMTNNHYFNPSSAITNTSQVPPLESPKKMLDDLILVSRKVLFSFSELHSSVRRFSGFCSDKKITIKMVSFLYTAKSNIDNLVETLELVEDSGDNDKIKESLHSCITSFKSIMSLLGENIPQFTAKIDVCFIRMLYLTIFGAFNELFNAYKILVKDHKPGLSINTSINNTSGNGSGSGPFTANGPFTAVEPSINIDNVEDVDEKLYESIEIATTKAQDVFGELTRAISQSAIASAQDGSNSEISPSLASKIKDLTSVCVSSMDIIKRLRTKLITIRNNPSLTTKKLFWDDINQFLKTIIQTFSSVKSVMKDLPILNNIRSSMAKLTKSTKDVTILLEASSYKAIDATQAHPPSLNMIPSVTNIFTPSTAHPSSHINNSHGNSLSQVNLASMQPPVRTPLVAALGPAAQAILPMSEVNPSPNITINNSVNSGYNGSINSSNTNTSGVSTSSPIISPNMGETSGQYFANNGINPFDGLIMASRDGNRERERERERDRDRDYQDY